MRIESARIYIGTTVKLTLKLSNCRIKAATNGCTTLPRESNKSPYAGRPKSPPTHDYENQHQLIQANGQSTTGRLTPPAYENVVTLPSPDHSSDQQVATPNNNRAPNWPEQNQQNGYASSQQQQQQSPPSPNYEEIGPENYRVDERQTTNGESEFALNCGLDCVCVT